MEPAAAADKPRKAYLKRTRRIRRKRRRQAEASMAKNQEANEVELDEVAKRCCKVESCTTDEAAESTPPASGADNKETKPSLLVLDNGVLGGTVDARTLSDAEEVAAREAAAHQDEERAKNDGTGVVSVTVAESHADDDAITVVINANVKAGAKINLDVKVNVLGATNTDGKKKVDGVQPPDGTSNPVKTEA